MHTLTKFSCSDRIECIRVVYHTVRDVSVCDIIVLKRYNFGSWKNLKIIDVGGHA